MYYVTKYALTDGMWEVEPQHTREIGDYLYVEDGYTSLGIQITKSDWFTDKELAVQRVKQLVEKKIKSLEKSIRKLKDLDPTLTVKRPRSK